MNRASLAGRWWSGARLGRVAMGLVKHAIVWIIEALVLSGVAGLSDQIDIRGFPIAMAVIVLIAAINTFAMPVLIDLAVRVWPLVFPVASFAINGVALLLLDRLLTGFAIDSVWLAGLTAALLAAVATLLGGVLSISDDAAWERFAIRPIRTRHRHVITGTTPGVAFLEIDGLSEPVLRAAIDAGYAPTMKAWLDRGSYRLVRWETDLSSQTSASQAGILLGDNDEVPGFRWYDKRLGRVVVSSSPGDSRNLQDRLSTGRGLLADGGASRGNMFSGDADDSLFTLATLQQRPEGSSRHYLLIFVNLYNVSRTLALFVADVVKEITAALWQRARDERPRVRRWGAYPLLRAATTSLLRELSTFSVAADLYRGIPSIYTTYVAYDEVAHHSGVQRGDAYRTLRDIDRDIGRLARVAARAPRPYSLVVLSDHGQSQGETFRQRYGMTLADLVDAAIAPGGPGGSGTEDARRELTSNEGWAALNALLTDYLRSDDKDHPVVTRALGDRLRDGQVAVGPPAIESDPAEADRVLVLASGNLGLISFPGVPGRLTLEAIEKSHPVLIPALVQHPGIGFILVRATDRGGLVIGQGGIYELDTDAVEGENPLAPFGPHAARHLRREDAFRNCPDLLVNSAIDPDTGEPWPFEELVGFHGGLGGRQTEPFLLYPSELGIGDAPIIGCGALHMVLKSWVRSGQGSATMPQS